MITYTNIHEYMMWQYAKTTNQINRPMEYDGLQVQIIMYYANMIMKWSNDTVCVEYK